MNTTEAGEWLEQIEALPNDCVKKKLLELFQTVTFTHHPDIKKTKHHHASIQETIHAPRVSFIELSAQPDDEIIIMN